MLLGFILLRVPPGSRYAPKVGISQKRGCALVTHPMEGRTLSTLLTFTTLITSSLSVTCVPVCPSIQLPTHPLAHPPSSQPSSHSSIHPSICPSIHPPSIHPSACPSIHPSFLSIIYHVSVFLSIYISLILSDLSTLCLPLPPSIHQLPPPFSSYAKCITLQLLHPTLNRHTLFHSADTFNHTLLTDTWLLHVFLLQR